MTVSRETAQLPWQNSRDAFYRPSVTTRLGLERVDALIRFGNRWSEFWYGRDWYIGSGLPFVVVDELAAIEGREDWDKL